MILMNGFAVAAEEHRVVHLRVVFLAPIDWVFAVYFESTGIRRVTRISSDAKRGRVIAVTAVTLTYQWAEMARMARGFGSVCPNLRQAAV